LSSVRTDSKDPWLYHKTTRRELYDAEYALAVRDGHVEVLFINERGELTEGSRTNVFVRRGRRLLTPPIDCGVLPGTRRAEILETDPSASEAVLTPSDLEDADEILVCNATTPLTSVILTTET
jgi:para-aminobenzoate synthetase/4-amino-4-deoxychorismate lyase